MGGRKGYVIFHMLIPSYWDVVKSDPCTTYRGPSIIFESKPKEVETTKSSASNKDNPSTQIHSGMMNHGKKGEIYGGLVKS